jgi:hypothetical protein
MLEIATADELRTVFNAPPSHTRMDLLKEIVNFPYTIPGISDGGAHTKVYCGGRYPTKFLESRHESIPPPRPGDLGTELVPLAQRVWRPEAGAGAANEAAREGEQPTEESGGRADPG